MGESSSTVRAASLEIDLGSTVGSYELVELLGKGAMGRVYRARHQLLGREVAIKVLNPELVARPEIVQRFFREARVVNEIDHQNIVEVTDFVEAPGLAYLVMELLDGVSLRELMALRRRKYPSVKRIVGLMSQLCAALEAAHEKGVVHRDLKPDNVFVVQRGGADFVKVLDFGVAKLRDARDGDNSTASGLIIGTPHYMSPEQALGREIDRRTDVWAAGVVLHELLSGSVPFTAPSFVELAMAIREQPPKALPRKTPRGERIPESLATVVTRCLEKRSADRFRSMAALSEALGAGRRRRTGVDRRGLAAAAALAVLAGGAAVAVRAGAPQRIRVAVAPTPTPNPDPTTNGTPSATPSPSPTRAATPTATPTRAATRTATPTPTPTAAKTTTTTATKAATRTATKASTATPVRTASTKTARETVELRLRSSPAGAVIVRLDTGQRLGKTPLSVNVARKAAVVWIRMALDGYEPMKFAVDLRKDNAANVTLRGARKSARATRR